MWQGLRLLLLLWLRLLLLLGWAVVPVRRRRGDATMVAVMALGLGAPGQRGFVPEKALGWAGVVVWLGIAWLLLLGRGRRW